MSHYANSTFTISEQPMEFDISPNVYRILEGSTATITCEVSGVSSEEVVWFKDEIQVDSETPQFEKVADGEKQHLIIHDVTLSETAVYSAEICGQRHTVAQLIVEGTK